MGRDWQNEVLGFSFADPWVLLALPAVVAIWWWRLRRRGPAVGFPDVGLFRAVPRTIRVRLASLPLHLVALGLVPVCIALARPQRLTRLPVESQGIDILLCLDLSSSMATRDMDASGKKHRLDVVKDVAEDFIDGRDNDRIGLVAFARFPDVVCPATLDHEALKRFLAKQKHKRRSRVGPPDPEDGTGIGRGLSLCVQRLQDSLAASRVVVLLTDGQETVGDITPDKAAKLAKDADIRCYTIGAGRGREHPMFGITQKPDFSALQGIADTTGGKFFEAETERALEQIFATIDKLERSDLEDPIYLADEMFFPFLAIGALLVFLALFMRLTWLVEVP